MSNPKITKNFLMVSNYNADISWILDYTDNYIIYDRSDTDEWTKPFDQSKVIRVKNIGWDIYDKFTYIIDNYDNLPDSIIMTKGNIFKYITKEEFDAICNNTIFTPIFTKHHKTKLPISFYSENGMYNEINNSWYLNIFPAKHFTTYNDLIWRYLEKIPKYIPFAPGSNYIVTKKDIQQYPKSFYEKLRRYINYSSHPGEAQVIERILYLLWSGKFNLELPVKLKIKNYIVTQIKNLLFIIKKVAPQGIKDLFKNQTSLESIKDYRKNVKIYDIFTYNGEADILEIRLNILKDHVDQFIVVEAPTTFSGLNKPLYFEAQKERFAPFVEKIKYFVIDDYPNDKELCHLADSSSNVPNNGPEHWRREFYQKESIKKALTHLQDNDICFIGDVDEIWNPEIIIDYTKDNIFKLRQDVYNYYLNNLSTEPWAGTLVTKYKNIKNSCLNHLRTSSKTNYTYLRNGGWHFTSIGGLEEVRRKLNDSYTEESYNTKDVQEKLESRFGKKDYLGRSFKFTISDKGLPKYITDNKERYQHLFKQDDK